MSGSEWHESPEAPRADDKDWTWVLERVCPECGFDASRFDVTSIGVVLRSQARRWRAVLARGDVAERPAPTTWSALEYAAHVRDVFGVYLSRLDRMLTEDGPRYANWDQDATAIESAYHQADPDIVADELAVAAEALARRFEAVKGDAWGRTGFRSDGANFTIESFARYFIHDPIHHLHDVGGS